MEELQLETGRRGRGKGEAVSSCSMSYAGRPPWLQANLYLTVLPGSLGTAFSLVVSYSLPNLFTNYFPYKYLGCFFFQLRASRMLGW
jgi:hypothetical protein